MIRRAIAAAALLAAIPAAGAIGRLTAPASTAQHLPACAFGSGWLTQGDMGRDSTGIWVCTADGILRKVPVAA